MSKYKQAVILAGGKGTRLEPYTACVPKPLMPIGDQPILEIVVKQLSSYGFKRIIMAVGHLSGLIQAYFGDGRRFGVDIEYSLEDKPLGTVGPLGLVKKLDRNFLILNGDLITDINYKNLFNQHLTGGNLCTIGVYKKRQKIDLGIIEFDRSNKITDYIEKPTVEHPISMGVYVFSKEILRFIPCKKKSDFPGLVKELIRQKQKIGAYIHKGYWCDIGNHDDYRRVNQELKDIRKKLLKKQ